MINEILVFLIGMLVGVWLQTTYPNGEGFFYAQGDRTKIKKEVRSKRTAIGKNGGLK